jgi:hypothetical protein
LTTDSFVDQELNFYPVYLGIIRFYPVRFYWKKNNEDILLKEE